MVGVVMVALAVPATLMVLGIRSMMSGSGRQQAPEVEGLRSSLESVAEKHFPAPGALGGGRRFVPRVNAGPGKGALLLEKSAAAFGGVAIATPLEGGGVRVVIQVPAGAATDFERTALAGYAEIPLSGVSDAEPGLYEIELP